MIAFVGFVSRILLGIVFLTAAVRKSGNAAAFAHTITQIGMSENLSGGIAWTIIGCEAILGVLFMLGLVPFIAIILAICLLVLFLGVSLRAMLLHQKVRCNCFGASQSLLGERTLLQAILLLLPVGGYALSTFSNSSIWWPTSPEMIVSSLSLVFGGIIVARWLLMVRTITDLARGRKQDDQASAQESLHAVQ